MALSAVELPLLDQEEQKARCPTTGANGASPDPEDPGYRGNPTTPLGCAEASPVAREIPEGELLCSVSADGAYDTKASHEAICRSAGCSIADRACSAACNTLKSLSPVAGLARSAGEPAAVAELLRTALVLLADHELTSSAFVARIAASTSASLPACLLAGLTTLLGPLHGDASGRVQVLFSEVERLGDEQVVAHYLSTGLPLAGFGHHLYPDGDPRAAALLSLFEPPEVIARFIQKVTSLTGLQPNVDVALAALVARLRLPANAALGLFATARSVGLLAHSLEQLGVPQVIRPRGPYVGPMPEIS
ncbi:MAG: citrate/2-methylcitrate synthase [Variovorax sp.]